MLVMPDRPTLHVIDSRRDAHLTFAAPDPLALGPRGSTTPRAPIAVGPGRAVIAEPNRGRAEHEAGVSYPIQPGKVQAPALRDETLARTRLLDWLAVKIHSRVVFVIADAGYGKTTLLADFSRRTRVRTIWYRLDEDDRDWVGFLSHLVAAGREFDPDFAPRTTAMLRSLEPDVLSELSRRTEGWAASLTLVQAALRERSPAETRSFVRSLSGARDELHDYLAEEVVGDLPKMQQQFLMRTSILQRVTPELAQVATGLSANEVQSMITEAERLGMLGRRANRRSSEQRYHPLVREFLEDRLRRELGAAGVNDLHVAVAR